MYQNGRRNEWRPFRYAKFVMKLSTSKHKGCIILRQALTGLYAMRLL